MFYEGRYRSSCCVYSINIFSFFSVKVYVKCVDKFILVYFESDARCSNGVKGSKKKNLLNVFVHSINHH